MTLSSSARVPPAASNQTTVPLSGAAPASRGVDAEGSDHLDKAILIGRLVRVFRKETSVPRAKLKDDDESTEGYISGEAYCEYTSAIQSCACLLLVSHPITPFLPRCFVA